MAISIPTTKFDFSKLSSSLQYSSSRQSSSVSFARRSFLMPAHCTANQQTQQQEDIGIMCEPCSGKGWLLCDFCNGQKTNVKAQNNNRIYRRCPTCRAIGYVLCSKCKVFKCVTFPGFSDGAGEV